MGMPPACKVYMPYIFHVVSINDPSVRGQDSWLLPCIYNQLKQCIYKYIPNKNQIVYVCQRIKLQQGLNSGKLV